MKVVLFCGGFGTRLRDQAETSPKPLVEIGYRPIIWYLMKYYAYYGHKDFILCLGYRGNMIKDYFLRYNECVSNDFVLSEGGRAVKLLNTDIEDWRVTFAETGLMSNLGQRLSAVRPYLEGEDVFLANYSDGLTDLPFDEYLSDCLSERRIASFLSVRPSQSLHAVTADAAGNVRSIQPIQESDFYINGGFFVFRKEIFDFIEEGEELVEAPFQRLIARRQLYTRRYRGFWAAMDTYKDKMTFDGMHGRGQTPWEVWRRPLPVPPRELVGQTVDRARVCSS
jgi:glucose-1-phosphate cytidylyltransferase